MPTTHSASVFARGENSQIHHNFVDLNMSQESNCKINMPEDGGLKPEVTVANWLHHGGSTRWVNSGAWLLFYDPCNVNEAWALAKRKFDAGEFPDVTAMRVSGAGTRIKSKLII